MGHRWEAAVGYCSRLVCGLVACAVAATTLHADVAAVTLVAAVMVVVAGIAGLMLRDGVL